MKLSILTPSIPERIFYRWEDAAVQNLAMKIEDQIGNLPVEHLILCDNKRRSIGAKRQALVDIARGEYIAFVDDDDDISDDYVFRLIEAIQTGADVITFRQRCIYNGAEGIIEFGLNYHDHPFRPGEVTHRAPWHVCAWKRERILGCQFGETNYGEDIIWCQQARRRIASGWHVDAILHTYRHDAATTAAPEPTKP